MHRMIRNWIELRIKWELKTLNLPAKGSIVLLTIAKRAGWLGRFFHVIFSFRPDFCPKRVPFRPGGVNLGV